MSSRETQLLRVERDTERARKGKGCPSKGWFRERHPERGWHTFSQNCTLAPGHAGDHHNGCPDEMMLSWPDVPAEVQP